MLETLNRAIELEQLSVEAGQYNRDDLNFEPLI